MYCCAGHLLTKSHGVVGCGVAETVAVATNSLFLCDVLLKFEFMAMNKLHCMARLSCEQSFLLAWKTDFVLIVNELHQDMPLLERSLWRTRF